MKIKREYFILAIIIIALVTYIVFENNDDVTTDKPDLLAKRLEIVLGALWEMRSQ